MEKSSNKLVILQNGSDFRFERKAVISKHGKEKQQTNRLPILTANRRDTLPKTQKRRQDNSSRLSVVVLPFRETGKPPLFVPVFRDVFHNLCDEKSIRISFPQLLLYAA